MSPKFPSRGFPTSEYEQRVNKAQALMRAAKIDALLLTTEPNFRYFTGFHSQFWHSPTRPWFVLVPANEKPIAIIPSIGQQALEETWIDDIQIWQSPCPEDEGISLLTQQIKKHCTKFSRLGMTLGAASHLRMPNNDFTTLRENIKPISIVDAMPLLTNLKNIKSSNEIDKIRCSCQITSQAFENLYQTIKPNLSERQICQTMRNDLINQGADETPYLVAASDYGGYQSIITGPTDRTLTTGDILMIDTGTIYDGYYCDFDRNYAVQNAPDISKKAHQILHQATEKAISLSRIGNTTTTLYQAMAEIIEQSGISATQGGGVGRLGHGLGMQLTEGFSLTNDDNSKLESGMVVTIEPSITFLLNGELKTMVHEENIAITEEDPELLTWRTPEELPVIT
jgi:Xaa-Pro aminopeptidase